MSHHDSAGKTSQLKKKKLSQRLIFAPMTRISDEKKQKKQNGPDSASTVINESIPFKAQNGSIRFSDEDEEERSFQFDEQD